MCDTEGLMSGIRPLKSNKPATTKRTPGIAAPRKGIPATKHVGEGELIESKQALQKLARRHPEIARALAALTANGAAAGVRSGKISARVDPGILAAAAERLGFAPTEVSDVVNAALAIAAAPDSFKDWFRQGGKQLPEDFALAI